MRRSSRSFVLCVLVALAASIRTSAGEFDPGDIPMHGGLDRQAGPVLRAADEALIESTTKEFGSRRAASERFVDQGFRFYFEDDLSTTMRRFNQGWLLDPENPSVYYGFMAVLNDREQFCAAREMVERAFGLGLQNKPEELSGCRSSARALCRAGKDSQR